MGQGNTHQTVWIPAETEVYLQLLVRDFRQTGEILVMVENGRGEIRLRVHKAHCEIFDVLGRIMKNAAFISVLS